MEEGIRATNSPPSKRPRARKILVCGSKDSANLSDFVTFFNTTRQSTTSLSPPKYSLSRSKSLTDTNGSTPNSQPPSEQFFSDLPASDVCKNGLKTAEKFDGAASASALETSPPSPSSVPEIILHWDGSNVPAGVLRHGQSRGNAHSSFDQSMWFNYGFTDETFKSWIQWQLVTRQSKLKAWAATRQS